MAVPTRGLTHVALAARDPKRAGRAGGIAHFGFRLQEARDIERARAAIRAAGATITDSGEFVPGEPYLFFRDPDGYTVEIWYELPTPVNPAARRRSTRSRR